MLLLLLSSSEAQAQEWLRDRENAEGPGVRLGDNLVFHPGLGIEAGYDSNFFFADDETRGTGVLRISTNLDLATRPPQRREGADGRVGQGSVDFRFGLGAAYYEYLTGDELIRGHRNVALDGHFKLHVLPGRRFSFFVEDTFVRGIHPQNEAGPRNYNRDTNDARIAFQYAPGGGQIEFRLGYAFQLRYFEEDGFEGTLQYLGNYTAHEVFTDIKWRFLPKTALVFSGIFRPIMRWNDGSAPSGTREAHDSYNVRANIGLTGLLTRRFSLLAQVGYAAGFYTGTDTDYEMVVGRVGLRFHISPTVQIALLYNRDYFDAVFSDWYSRDRVSASYHHLIAGRVMLRIAIGFSYLGYSDVVYPIGTFQDRNDPLLDVEAFVEYRIRDWIAINLSLEYNGNYTSFIAPTLGFEPDPGNYNRFSALAGVRVMY